MTMRVLFMGTPSFAVPSLTEVAREFSVVGVVSQPDRPSGRGKRVKPTPVKEKATELGLEVFQPERKQDLKDIVQRLKPECIVVVAYGMILPKEIIYYPPYGAINLHASLLPKYRGAAPIQRAIMAGESKTGNTIMMINESMDAGDILAVEEEAINPEDNFQTLSERLSLRGANLLVRTLRDWVAGRIEPQPQNHEEATYAPPVRKEEFRLCWKAEACSVVDRVRGLYPNTYAIFRGQRIKLLRLESVNVEGEPGEILEDKALLVGCGEGAVRVKELISPKGRRMSGEEFVRGYTPKPGERME